MEVATIKSDYILVNKSLKSFIVKKFVYVDVFVTWLIDVICKVYFFFLLFQIFKEWENLAYTLRKYEYKEGDDENIDIHDVKVFHL